MRRLLFIALVSIYATAAVGTQTGLREYPGASWDTIDAARAGWSIEKLGEARRYFDALPHGSALIVEHGHVIVEWGDPAKRVKLSSVRKSFLSVCTVFTFGRDDWTCRRLWRSWASTINHRSRQSKRAATLRMVLQAESGVYHAYVGGLARRSRGNAAER